MTTHYMIDLETLGTGDHAPIVQIAASWFSDQGEIWEELGAFNVRIDMNSEHFGKIEPATVQWWMQQGEEARDRVFRTDHNRTSLELALLRFPEALPLEHGCKVWGNGSLFDLRLLKQAYERCGQGYPIHYRSESCFRTMKQVGDRLGVEEPVFDGVVHDALDDARHQAKHLFAILQVLEGCR